MQLNIEVYAATQSLCTPLGLYAGESLVSGRLHIVIRLYGALSPAHTSCEGTVWYCVHPVTRSACSCVIKQAFYIMRTMRLLSMAPEIVVATLLQL